MKVQYIGKASDPLEFIHGKVYERLDGESMGLWRVVDETGDDYLFPPSLFKAISDEEAKKIVDGYVPHECPICGEHEFSMEKSYEYCPVCRWCDTDDAWWNYDLSEEEYRKAYLKKRGVE